MDVIVDGARLDRDPGYRDQLAKRLLATCGKDADHVELRRTAMRVFPELSAGPQAPQLAMIVGQAATLRVSAEPREERDVTDARLEMTATDPLPYTESYAELDDPSRSRLIAFCERELIAGREGPAALDNLLRLHGWPYSERTFYVGPWKAARLRLRRRNDD